MQRDNKPYSQKRLRNNGKDVGTVTLYTNNLKSIIGMGFAITFGVGVVVGFGAGYAAGRNSVETEVNQVVYNTLSESYFDEPTYNGIPYTVKFGDTVSSIVYSYESDPNEASRLIRQIEEFNNINANQVRDGQTIYLYGVPSSRLEDFGYTDNYNLFGATVEADIRIDFLDKVVDSISSTDGLDNDFVNIYRQTYADYLDYKQNYLPGDEEYVLPEIIERLVILCDEAEQYGYSFGKNLKALPLSEAEITKTSTKSF